MGVNLFADSADYGTRADGTPKGDGYFGKLKRPDGRVSTEISMGVNFDGKETEIPTLVPGLDKNERNYLLNSKLSPEMWNTPTGKNIAQKAVGHARMRMDKGLSPFAQKGERSSGPLTENRGTGRNLFANNQMKGNQPEAKKMPVPLSLPQPEGMMGGFIKPTLKDIGGGFSEVGRDLSKGINPLETVSQTAKGLGLGMVGFMDMAYTQTMDAAKQLAGKGDIDWNAVKIAGDARHKLYDFVPTDPGAKTALGVIGVVPQGVKLFFENLAEPFKESNPNIYAGLKTMGDMGELAAFGKVFKAMGGATLKPKIDAVPHKGAAPELDTLFAREGPVETGKELVPSTAIRMPHEPILKNPEVVPGPKLQKQLVSPETTAKELPPGQGFELKDAPKRELKTPTLKALPEGQGFELSKNKLLPVKTDVIYADQTPAEAVKTLLERQEMKKAKAEVAKPEKVAEAKPQEVVESEEITREDWPEIGNKFPWELTKEEAIEKGFSAHSHRAFVKGALDEGKTVSKEILKSYPELVVKKPEPKQAVKPQEVVKVEKPKAKTSGAESEIRKALEERKDDINNAFIELDEGNQAPLHDLINKIENDAELEAVRRSLDERGINPDRYLPKTPYSPEKNKTLSIEEMDGAIEAEMPEPKQAVKPPEKAKGKEAKTALETVRDHAYKSVDRNIFRDGVSKTIQNDGQKLLDALDSNDANELDRLSEKYAKDVGRDQGGGGAGPGKVKQAQRGGAIIGRIAREGYDKAEKLTPVPEKTDVALEGKGVESIGKAWINNQKKPIISAREITKGKFQGKVEITLTAGRDAEGNVKAGKKVKVERKAVIDWPGVKKFLSEEKGAVEIDLSIVKDIGKGAKEAYRDIKKMGDEYLGSISTRLGNIDPELKNHLRKFEFKKRRKTLQNTERVLPMLKKIKKMSAEDRATFDLARKNADSKAIKSILHKYDMFDEYKETRKVLNEMYEEVQAAGFDTGFRKTFHPRLIKDPEGFLTYLQKGTDWPLFDKAIKEKEVKLNRYLEADEKAQVINTMLRGFEQGGIRLSKPGQLKARTVREVTPELNKFYMGADASLLQYIDKVTAAIESRKIFGKGDNINDSIGHYVLDLVARGKITPRNEIILRDILNARFNERGTRGVVGMYKNLSYIDTMGSPISAITQIGDLAWALYKNGVPRTAGAAITAIRGKSLIKPKDLGIERIAEEFTEPSRLSSAVNTVFKAVGLEKIDFIGKEALITSTIKKAQAQAKSTNLKKLGKLKSELKPIFGDETMSVINDLRDGNISENVKLYAFNVLSDFQPITLSEMPQKYLTGGNGRIFYMLKTFTLKQFDVYRREVFQQIGKPGTRMKGIKNLIKLSACFVAANATADTIKSIILNRPLDPEDLAVDNLLRLFGISKFVTWKAREEGVGSAMVRQVAPPFKFIDAVTKDISTAGDEKGLETTASIPLIGKLYYWWFGKGVKKSERRRKKTSKKTTRFQGMSTIKGF